MQTRTLMLVGALLAALPAYAQQPQTTRLRGTVEKVDGATLTVKNETGEVKLALGDKLQVFGVVKATLADVKPNAFIGVGAMPQTDGSQKAIQVMIFAESQRGLERPAPQQRPPAQMQRDRKRGDRGRHGADRRSDADLGHVHRTREGDGQERQGSTCDKQVRKRPCHRRPVGGGPPEATWSGDFRGSRVRRSHAFTICATGGSRNSSIRPT